MKAPRVFQLTALALVLVSTVEVGWWLLDQHRFAVDKVRQMHQVYAQQVVAAQALLDAGTPALRVHALLPGVIVKDQHATLSPEVDRQLLAEEHRHIAQYAWEGSFFIIALAACITVIARALRAEARIIREQESFLALVSHQFKTPLASLQLSLETMAMRTLSPEHSRALIERMLSDLARMEGMVTQILESMRLERGRIDLRPEPVDLGGAVARVLAGFGERAAKDHVTVSADIERGLQVMSDPLALDVVLRNVLENALAAVAPVGGGSITFTGRRAAGEVELSVRDSGIGFRPADAARLFQKFTRLHPGGGGSHFGTGLGLYIVRRLMQLTGGEASAQSAGIGRGATFVLRWPAGEPGPVRSHAAATDGGPLAGQSARREQS
ncbi:MAG: HAMP domain-containing histidine kinase [Gammaproteobacteria bacterium]|nr:HAMP domain-containing histidine kinase [Gammaproteobacteria bacterium]MDE2261107.1 HAMP domain-containing histidine kinase [Gammaproteobacteria bacterium]